MRRHSRRRIATLIRIRQEIDKRLDPALPWRAGPLSLAGLFDPRFARELSGSAADGDSLRSALAARAATRFPLAHLRRRDPAQLPARRELALQIADAASGRWSVFGTPVAIEADRHDWTRHPTTDVAAPTGHWARLSYMGGVGGGDVKAIWELSRHHDLLRLAQGYYLDRDESLATKLLVLLERWLGQNPPSRGINWASSLEVAFRAIAWCWIWALTCDSPAWTRSRVSRFLVSLWHHARHIERFDSIHHSPNTHLTGEGLGLLYVGLLFPELVRADRWARRGQEILESELDLQVFDDGMHFERAVGYHRYTAEFYVHYLLLADAFGIAVDPEIRKRIRAQIDATRCLRRPDGSWPVIGDEDSSDTLLLTATDPHDQGPLLALGGALFDERSWVALTSAEHRAAGWWLLDDARWDSLRRDSRSASGTPASCALETAGYFVGRDDDGPDGWWCLVDVGPHGGDQTGHAHTDLGHVEIAHGSTHIIVDPGCAGYTIDPRARDLARSEVVHACLVIDGEPLAVPAGPFSWSRVAPAALHRHADDGAIWWCELSYARDHARGRLTHRRQVVLVRGEGVFVCDSLDGVAPTSLALHWPLDDAPPGDALAGNALTTANYSVNWSLQGGSGDLHPSLEPLVQSSGYGRQRDARLLRIAYSGALPVSVISCFTDADRSIRVQTHGESVRLLVTAERGDEGSVVNITPGAPPAIERSRAPITSHGAVG